MSMEKEDQECIITCDYCGKNAQVNGHNFKEAWEHFKDKGWRCFKNDEDEWEHRCPGCRGR